MATAAKAPSRKRHFFANGTNAYYAEEMYKCWREDPQISSSLLECPTSGMDKGLSSAQAFQPPQLGCHLLRMVHQRYMATSGGAELDVPSQSQLLVRA
ncbi:2-oxoglutarate dehydrogenase E1 component [Paramarasmius palmivorus]|uniref:2-oxoglutarate dehydrogenase E1 component n=1 Tax=Paramarasmius palmivorus TaxID=297713 RepID=A0AAW0AP16_9AGAR